MNCPSCGVSNLPNRHYCRKCGFSLGYPCPACRFFNSKDDTYCGGCGINLKTAEKKNVIVSAPSPSSEPPSEITGEDPSAGKEALKEIFKKAPRPEDQQIFEKEASQSDIDSIFEGMREDGRLPEEGKPQKKI